VTAQAVFAMTGEMREEQARGTCGFVHGVCVCGRAAGGRDMYSDLAVQHWHSAAGS
jgi:hypothetical protein